jgi:hypothetical protein
MRARGIPRVAQLTAASRRSIVQHAGHGSRCRAGTAWFIDRRYIHPTEAGLAVREGCVFRQVAANEPPLAKNFLANRQTLREELQQAAKPNRQKIHRRPSPNTGSVKT